MAKAAPDAMIDAALDYVAASNILVVCSAEPTTYAEATSTYALADVALTPGDGNGDFTVGNGDTSGRKVTVGAQSGVTIDSSGTATHVAVCLSSDSTLRYVTTCTSQALVAAGTVDVPAWDIEIADPT